MKVTVNLIIEAIQERFVELIKAYKSSTRYFSTDHATNGEANEKYTSRRGPGGIPFVQALNLPGVLVVVFSIKK